MEQLDEKPVVAEEFENLHAAIGKGDFESVKQIVDNHGKEKYFSYDDTSALYKAFESKKYEIISFLIHKGAKFVGSEHRCVYDFDIDLDRLNYLLFEYNKKSDKSCVYRLMSLSQSPQGLDRDRLKALKSMYKFFFQSDIIKLLLNILESVDFDIVFDFESDKVNRVHRLYEEEAEVFGLTLSIVREIFIGANNLLSGDPKKMAKVYGVVAEELCHLALTAVFDNDAKPYKEEDSKSIHEFQDIVLAVKSLADRTCHIESVIQDVYDYYNPYSWECELIARVPHVIGIYGEESGKRIFQESSELSRLFDFYEQNVLPKCREYVDPLLNTKSDRIMKQLMGKNEFISFKEKQICPLKKSFASFREYMVIEEGVSVISTNCVKLCNLHVYHELKAVYGDQLERKCLLFGSECFEKKRDEILNALKCKLCEYLVLVLDDKELHHRRLLCEYLDDFEKFKNEGKNIIIISNSQFLGPEFQKKAVEYKWDDLTDEYKDFRTQCKEYIFKGERQFISIKKENVPKFFTEEDIFTIISGDLIEVQDIADLGCQGYNHKTYVEREFWATIIDRNIFERLPNDTSFLIYGLSHWDIEELSCRKSKVQQLKGSDDDIQKGKAIFINNRERPMSFKDFVEKTAAENIICLRYDRKVYYLMNSKGDVCQHFTKKIKQTEEEIIDFLKSNKTLIISENAGCGKSTVMSHLIWHVKNKIYNSWVLRVDLNKFSIEDEGPDCEENDEEDVFEDIFDMLGFENGFQKCHFRNTDKQGNYFIFLDAFDEIPLKYKTKALKLISFLRKNTDAKIMITTRMHHQQELEEILNTFSHQLVPFDKSTQVNCLTKLWKWKLKFPDGEGRKHPQKDKKAISRKIKSIIGELEKEKTNSESHDLILALKEMKLVDSVDLIRGKIDGLKFNGLANYILNKACLDKETLQFMGIPLHLFMIGEIYLDSHFSAEIKYDIHSIYSEFIEKKINIFVEEKQGISYSGRGKKTIIEKEKKDAYRVHIQLANQLMDEGKIDSDMEDVDLELCTALGIVFIYGEQIDFLHHTFAEFFKAESIRMNLNKKGFIDVLSDEKYKVVIRFLASSLEKNNFENLTKEFLEDVDFLVSVLKQLVDEFQHILHYVTNYEVNLHLSFIAKIVKSLLETFENTVNPNMLNEFILKLSELSLFQNWNLIGGCLTIKMFKMLFDQNAEVGFKMIFSVVIFYSNPEEVIKVLNECISIESAVECETSESENENIKGKRLLKVLKLKDSVGNSLFFCAMRNVRIEVFPKILEYSKHILGKEEFIDVIIKSEEYFKAMDDFIRLEDFNRICKLLKACHSVFCNEIEMLFDKNLKFRILSKTVNIRDESRNAFEETINLFKECFEIENLEEVLLSCDSDGKYLNHNLVSENRNLIENLNIVKRILDEKSKMKQFLMSKDLRFLRNIFHFAAENENINFGVIMQFCSDYFEEQEIKKLLFSGDKDGENVLHSLFRYNSSEGIIEGLNVIKNTLADEELFKKLLKSKNRRLNNIFHFASGNRKEINISFLNLYLCESEIKYLLFERDEDFRTFLHFGANFHSANLLVLFEYSSEILKVDKSQLEELILAEDNYGNTFLHLFVKVYSYNFREVFVNKVIESVKEKVSDDIFKKLLRVRNKNGNTFLQIKSRLRTAFFGEKFNDKRIECFKRILEKSLFEELLQ